MSVFQRMNQKQYCRFLLKTFSQYLTVVTDFFLTLLTLIQSYNLEVKSFILFKSMEELEQNFHNSELCLQPQLIHHFFLPVSGCHSITYGAAVVFHVLCSALLRHVWTCVGSGQGDETQP